MQLIVTLIGNQSAVFLTDILTAISSCSCTVAELRASKLAQVNTCYILVNANWNNIAKLEALLNSLASKLSIQMTVLRPDEPLTESTGIPYMIEAISVENNQVLEEIIQFLLERNVEIEDVNVNTLQSSYSATLVLSIKIILLVPLNTRLLLFREEFLDFCDNLNIDTMIEPLKR